MIKPRNWTPGHRNNNLQQWGMMAVMGGGAFHLPYTIDFTLGSMGKLVGQTWGANAYGAINTPTLDANMLTDPGLEANYTAGKCDTLSKYGSPTLSQSADSHGGSKAQNFQATGAGDYVYWTPQAGLAGQWYQFGIWGKCLSGTANDAMVDLGQTNGLPSGDQMVAITNAAYVKYLTSLISIGTDNLIPAAVKGLYGSPWDAVEVDDGYLGKINYASLFAIAPSSVSDVVAKIQLNFLYNDASLFGLVLRASTQSSPSNAVFILCSVYPGYPALANVSVIKKVGSTYTSVLTPTIITIAANAWLEVRSSGSAVSVWYNNAQVGGNLTISDAELISNKFHGIFSSGGNSIKSFLALAS